MGKSPKCATQQAVFIEYANIILYFYQTATYLLKMKLPQPWLQTAMQRVNRVLTGDSDEIKRMQELLLKVIKMENLNIKAVLG